MNTAENWDQVWKEKVHLYNADPRRDPVYEAVLGSIKQPKSTILDIGGGASKFSVMAKERGHFPGILDYSPWAIEYMLNKYGIPGFCGDISKDDFSRIGIFDVSVCLGVLEHLEDEIAAVRLMKDHSREARIMVPNNHLGHPSWWHLRCYTEDSLRELLSPYWDDLNIYVLNQYLMVEAK